MTAIIFYTAFIGIYGFIIGKSFKRLNPFLMLIGMMFTLPIIMEVERYEQPLLYIPFGIGFFTNFGNPFRRVIDFFNGIKYSIQDARDRRRYAKQERKQEKQRAKQQKENYQHNSDNLNRQKEDIEAELNRNQRKAQEEINRQEKEVQKRLRREAEELQRQREQFQREQAQARKNKSYSNNNELNPKIFKDACEILGCKDTDTKAKFKKSYQYLRAIYHPDKMELFGGRRKKQAEEEMKLINLAWKKIKSRYNIKT